MGNENEDDGYEEDDYKMDDLDDRTEIEHGEGNNEKPFNPPIITVGKVGAKGFATVKTKAEKDREAREAEEARAKAIHQQGVNLDNVETK